MYLNEGYLAVTKSLTRLFTALSEASVCHIALIKSSLGSFACIMQEDVGEKPSTEGQDAIVKLPQKVH
jgi:hypothetical protein